MTFKTDWEYTSVAMMEEALLRARILALVRRESVNISRCWLDGFAGKFDDDELPPYTLIVDGDDCMGIVGMRVRTVEVEEAEDWLKLQTDEKKERT